MSRRARARTSLFGFAVLLILVPIFARFRVPHLLRFLHIQAPAHAQDLEVNAIRAGLDAKALAAAGVSAQATSTIVTNINAYLLDHGNDLSLADSAYAGARTESDRLQRKIQSGQGSQEEISSYQTQAAALATATTSRQAALDAIFNAGAANLSEAQKTTLATIRTNRASWDSPLEFLTVERSQQEWVHLRDCLTNERVALEYPETLDQGMQAELATWRANQAVAAAIASQGANLSAVTNAWNTAMHE
jgi:hypothetical protein